VNKDRHRIDARLLLLRGTGQLSASRDLEILRTGQRRGVGDGTLPAVGEICRADVYRQSRDGNQDDEHQRRQDDDLTAVRPLWTAVSSARHGFFGSIRSSVVVERQKTADPHEGAMNRRPGKKIGTT